MQFNVKFRCKHKEGSNSEARCGQEISATFDYMADIQCEACKNKWRLIHIIKTVDSTPTHYAMVRDLTGNVATFEMVCKVTEAPVPETKKKRDK